MELYKINQFIIMALVVGFRYVALFYSSTILNFLLLFLLCWLVFLNIRMKKIRILELRKIVILVGLSAIIFLVYNEDNLFIYLMGSLAFLESDDREIVKGFWGWSIVYFIGVIIAGKLGIIDVVVAGRYIDNETVYRNSLGFGNVNTASIYFLGIVFGIYYLFGEARGKLLWGYGLTTLIAIWIYKETDCRSGFYIYLLFVICSLLYGKRLKKIGKLVIPAGFGIFMVLSFGLAIVFGGTFDNSVNTLLSGRPYFSNFYIKNWLWISLLGTGVVGSRVLDNYYLSLMVKTGLVGYLTYFYIFRVGGKYLKDDAKALLILLFVFIYGVMECNLYGNFIYMLLLKKIIKGVGVNENERVN